MAKVVNTFVKGKLNKDLDARLIPNGEYRDARNVQVSKSEGPDVGELENVLGNELISNIKSSIKNIEVAKSALISVTSPPSDPATDLPAPRAG